MELRLLEIVVPSHLGDEVRTRLEPHHALDVWSAVGDDDRTTVRALVPGDQAEAVADDLTGRLGSTSGFRLVVLGVETTVPRPSVSADTKIGTGRVSRQELYANVARGAQLTWVYVVTVALSAVVAAIGLLRGDVATVIGAMVIAPLLGPNMALGLAVTLGDVGLIRTSLRAIAVGLSVAFGLSLFIGVFFEVDPTVPVLASRARVDAADAVLAFAAGTVGALASSRGVSSALIGVMVAVALLPPWVSFGLLLGGGYSASAGGAALLTLTNVTCVNLAAMATFVGQGIAPRSWWSAERAKRATSIALRAWLGLLALLGLLIFALNRWGPA